MSKKPQNKNIQHLREQASAMEKLGNVLSKNAKTKKELLNAKICQHLSEVAKLLADYLLENNMRPPLREKLERRANSLSKIKEET